MYKQERRDHHSLSSMKKIGAFVKGSRWSSSKRALESIDRKRELALESRNLASARAIKSHLLDDTIDSICSSRPILQSMLHPNDPFVRDDYYGPHDSYDVELLSPPKSDTKETSLSSRRTRPRLTGFIPWRSGRKYDVSPSDTLFLQNGRDYQAEKEKQDENMTTLLHEACRLAHPEFVRLLLSQGGNPNVRNGQQRTALHMVAGGVLERDTKLLEASDVGIRMPHMDLNANEAEDADDSKIHKMAARAVNRLRLKFKERESAGMPLRSHPDTTPSDGLLDTYASQRLDTLLTILSWFHPDDNTPAAGEGPTINSVDQRGRTALHYSAELGRTDMCLTILTSFGAILTIVDDAGQTPGELAAEQNHPDLAAQLEARALLYTDPYGLDEDLLASVWENSSDDQAIVDDRKLKKKKKHTSHSKLVPPFSWFETWTIEKVRLERHARAVALFGQMKDALTSSQELRESMEFMFNHGLHDSDDADVVVLSENDAVLSYAGSTMAAAEKVISMSKNTRNPDDTGGNPHAVPKMGLNDAPSQYLSDMTADESTTPNVELSEGTAGHEKPAPPSQSVVESQDLVWGSSFDERATHRLVPILDKSETKAAFEVSKAQSEYEMLSKTLQLVHVEKFAGFHSWNAEVSLKAFKEDPFAALISAGVDLPFGAGWTARDMNDDPTSTRMCLVSCDEVDRTSDSTERDKNDDPKSTLTCLICCDEIDGTSDDWVELTGCDHAFCAECLGDYVAECSKSKEFGVTIKCPHHECSSLMSFEEIQRLAPSPGVYESLQKASDEMFVAAAEDLCFCPHPGCDMIVRRVLPSFVLSAKLDRNLINLCGAVCAGAHVLMARGGSIEGSSSPLTYDGVPDASYRRTGNSVQPKKPHRFCFSCSSQTMHWPINCEALEQWKEKIAHEVGEVGEEPVDGVNFNDVAQRLWMKANTRPCPKCKAPIEKNDGCNHMTCSNRSCRHEFCWICREDWKIHNTETGGFFRCNRWQADDNHNYYDSDPPEHRALSGNNTSDPIESPEVSYGTALHSSRVAWQKSKDMGLFLHNYRRWTGHAESAALERQMADTVCVRLAPVVEAAIDFNGQQDFDFRGKGLSFIHDAFIELLECRSLLQHSYAFAFFRYPIKYHIRRDRLTKSKEREKLGFERLQSELEMLTEQLSDIVARKHLRATQMQIMFLTKNGCHKRGEFTSLMLSLLNEQLKEEAKRASKEKDAPAVNRIGHDVGSIFDFASATSSGRRYRHRDHVSSRLRRLMEDHPQSRRFLLPDSDDDDDFGFPSRSFRTRVAEQDAVQAELFPGAYFPFDRHDTRASVHEPPRFQDWACSECTYMNAGGRRCAMCGTFRR
jgi:ankyrin repeat protein